MKYTESFSDDGNYDGDCSALPQMRPCSTATTISQRRAERAANRRVAFDDRTSHRITVSSNANTPQSPGGNTINSCISLGENSYDETIYSSSMYSLHNYSPAAMKEKKKKEEQASLKNGNLLCPSSLTFGDMLDEVEGTFEDTVKSFKQVFYSFVISPDDIDGMAAAIHDARDEILEIELERRWSSVRNLESKL